MKIIGLAVPFLVGSVPEHDGLPFAPGAFTAAIAAGDAKVVFDYGPTVASQADGSLSLRERPPSAEKPARADWNFIRYRLGGLLFSAEIRDPAMAEKVAYGIRSGDVRHCCVVGKYSKAIVDGDGNRVAISRVVNVTISLLSRATGSCPTFPATWVLQVSS